MASHGAMKAVAAEAPAQRKLPPKELHHIELREAENGGAVAEHHFMSYEHKPETHVFGDGDGKKLAAHIEKHLGISMPGKERGSAGEEKEPDEE